jgi:predicted unusual protein kinase regulating ubiquinone biosynthesis (AarF/ABC1/UbiB family)
VIGDAEHIGLVDFGQVGKLTDEDMSKLTRLFIDAASERIDALPRRLAELGVRYPEGARGRVRRRAARDVRALLRGEPAEIDPLQVIREAFQLIYRLNLRLPTRFVMLDKAIATLGSVGVELYPDFNVFEVARPYARGLMLERYTPQRVLKRARSEGSSWRGSRATCRTRCTTCWRSSRRPDRGRLRAQGPRRVHAQARRRVQPARDRAGHGRRA